MTSSLIPHYFFTDDFNDNTTSPRWQLLQVNGATASETNQRLQVTVPSGSGWAQAGYVTVDSYTLKEHIIRVNVPSRGNLNEMTLQICLTKVSSDPYSENNWYRIQKTSDNSFRVQRRINGGSPETLQTFTSSSQQLVIKIQDGVIQFYDNINLGTLIYSQTYAIITDGQQNYDCYVYVFTSSQRDSASGTGAFDDFAISPIIVHLSDKTFDFNCYSGSTLPGGRGVTIWGPYDLPNALSPDGYSGQESAKLRFTPSEPRCYAGKDCCNVTFTMHTESNSNVDVRVEMQLWGKNANDEWITKGNPSDNYHSRISGDSRDTTFTVELAAMGDPYEDTKVMALTFKNKSPVHVWIKSLQIVRVYGMKYLTDQGTCNNEVIHDASGDFATRYDYPCDFDSCGGMSYTGFYYDNTYFQQVVNGHQPDGTILYRGSTYQWNWTNPNPNFPAFSGSTNYIRAAHCLFNFNNVYLCNDDGEKCDASTNEVPFLVKLNNSAYITLYQCKTSNTMPHGIDLATHSYLKNYYNDSPGTSNTLYLQVPSNPDPGVNLFLHDGETGLINIYRVYETKPCCPTISSSKVGNGTISPTPGPFTISSEGRTFDMTPDNDNHLSDVTVDGTSKGAVDPYTVYMNDSALDYTNRGMEGHQIVAYFECGPICQTGQTCWPCYVCNEECQVVCMSCVAGCEGCQGTCYGCYDCQSCVTCNTCQDCQTCVSCQNLEYCYEFYYTCQGCETCQPGYT